MQNRIFYAVCFGFILGILFRSLVFANIYLILFLGTVSLGLLLIFLILKNKWGLIASIFIIFICLGAWRFHISDKFPTSLEPSLGTKATLTGVVVDEPDVRENNEKLTVEVEEGGEKVKVLLTTNFGDYKYGDKVSFSGKLERPENFTTDQGKEFDYVNYLRKDEIFYISSYPKVEVISSGHGFFIKRWLFALKKGFVEKIDSVISPPESLLMNGLILGERSSFSEELRENFIKTGTIHIIALSGYNVTIVAEWLMRLLSHIPFLSHNLGYAGGILAISAFVLMTGAGSTAIRAGIMATLALVARGTGRSYEVGRALLIAGVLMILLNPFVLVYDVSFQLSFIATVAVIFFAPRIERYFMWVSKKFELRDIVSVTAAAYILVFPFVLYKMGNFSTVALPANMLVLPFIPFTMLLGFLTGILGFVWYGFSVPLGFISYLFLHYELSVISFLAEFPLSSFAIPNFPLVITLAVYVYFTYLLFGQRIKEFFTQTLE